MVHVLHRGCHRGSHRDLHRRLRRDGRRCRTRRRPLNRWPETGSGSGTYLVVALLPVRRLRLHEAPVVRECGLVDQWSGRGSRQRGPLGRWLRRRGQCGSKAAKNDEQSSSMHHGSEGVVTVTPGAPRAGLAHRGRAHSGPASGPTRNYTVRGGRSRPSGATVEQTDDVAGKRSAPEGGSAFSPNAGEGSGGAEHTAEQRLQEGASGPASPPAAVAWACSTWLCPCACSAAAWRWSCAWSLAMVCVTAGWDPLPE